MITYLIGYIALLIFLLALWHWRCKRRHPHGGMIVPVDESHMPRLRLAAKQNGCELDILSVEGRRHLCRIRRAS